MRYSIRQENKNSNVEAEELAGSFVVEVIRMLVVPPPVR